MSAAVRIVHIGDLHLGPNARQADRLAALDQIIASEVDQPDLALWLLTGDLFHSNSRIEDRNEVAPRIQQMANVAPVLVVRGNHDAHGDLDILARLEAAFEIRVCTRPEVAYLPPVAVAAIPYPDRAGIVGAGVASAAVEQTGTQLLDTLCMALAEDLARFEAEGAAPIVALHANVQGARASTGQPQIGQEVDLALSTLERFTPTAHVAAGHIHKHQQVGRAVYAGSICRLDYGEVEPKGYVAITYVQVGAQWQHTWEFIELPVAPLIHVEGNLTREGFTYVCTSGVGGDVVEAPTALCDDCRGADPQTCSSRCANGRVVSFRGTEVRCRYTFPKAEIGVLDVAQIHATFAEAKSLKLDPVPVLAHTVRAPQVAEAPTLEKKVQAVCEVQGIPWTPGLAAKLAALQTQDPATILAAVAGEASPAAATPAQPELAEVQS